MAQLKAINARRGRRLDLQHLLAVVAKSGTDDMVDQIVIVAKTDNVDLFERFAIDAQLQRKEHRLFDMFVAPDHLHMNDWSYGCVAKLLTGAIAEAATRPITSAAAHPALTGTPAKSGVQ